MSNNQEFADSVNEAILQIIADTAKNTDTACYVVEAQAKQNCPVDMGQLRASITSETEITEEAVVGRIGSNLDYAPYVHQGTGIYAKDGNGRQSPWGYTVLAGKYKGFHWTWGQRPNPFLEKARNEKKNSVERILGGD